MPKKNEPIKSLPGGKVPEYFVSGVSPEDEARVRAHISDMAPDAYPQQIAFLPAEQYRKVASQISKQGTFGGAQISRGNKSQESFGSNGGTQIGNAFSMPSTTGRMYVNADLLHPKRENDLKDLLGHELGHFAAVPKHDSSEDTADEWRDKVYRPREKQQEALTKTMADLPATHYLGSALPPVQPLAPAQTYLGSALPKNAPAAQPIPEMSKPDNATQTAAEEATKRGQTLSRR
jgi:hypothetical protein